MLGLLRRSPLAKNAGWMLAGQGAGYGLRVVYFFFIARLLGALEYGIVVGALALVMLVSQYSRLGMGTVLMRYVSGDHARFAVYWGNVVMVTTLMSGALVFVLHLLGNLILDPATAAVVVMTAIGSVLCEQLATSATQAFQAHQSMRAAALMGQLIPLFRTLTAIVLLFTLHHTTARVWVVWSMIASAAACIVAVSAVTIKLGWPSFKPLFALQYVGEGLEYSFAGSTVSAFNDLDKTMLSHYGMAAMNGIYGLAYRMVDVGTVPLVAIQLAAEPRLFQLAKAGPEGPIDLGRRLLRHCVLVSAAASAALFLFAPLLPIMTGKGFSEAIDALRWLCLIPVFRTVHQITGSVFTSLGLQRYRTLTQVGAVVLNLGLNVWLIPTHGWHGAAWSSLATDGSLGLINWSLLQRYTLKQRKLVAGQCA